MKMTETMKRCAGCKPAGIPPHHTPISEFNKSRNVKSGLQHHCRSCQRNWNVFNNPKRYGPNADPKLKATTDACDARKRITRRLRRPVWLTKSEDEAIRDLYAKRNEMNKRDGAGTWSIDHIIPLQGKTVSGLHVVNNLEIVKTLDNLSKSNSWDWEAQSC